MAAHYQTSSSEMGALIVIIVAVALVHDVEATCTSSYSYMTSDTGSSRGMMLSNHLTRNVTGVRSAGECLTICLRHGDNCQSFNYASGIELCHVNDAVKGDYSNDFVSDADFNYYEPSSSHWLVSTS